MEASRQSIISDILSLSLDDLRAKVLANELSISIEAAHAIIKPFTQPQNEHATATSVASPIQPILTDQNKPDQVNAVSDISPPSLPQPRKQLPSQSTPAALTTSQKKQKTRSALNWDVIPRRRIALRFSYIGTEYNGFSLQKGELEHAAQDDTKTKCLGPNGGKENQLSNSLLSTTNSNANPSSTNKSKPSNGGQQQLSTVEGKLLHALIASCLIPSHDLCNYTKGGRTDRGVHGLSQIVALDIKTKWKPPSSLLTHHHPQSQQQQVQQQQQAQQPIDPFSRQFSCWCDIPGYVPPYTTISDYVSRNQCMVHTPTCRRQQHLSQPEQPQEHSTSALYKSLQSILLPPLSRSYIDPDVVAAAGQPTSMTVADDTLTNPTMSTSSRSTGTPSSLLTSVLAAIYNTRPWDLFIATQQFRLLGLHDTTSELYRRIESELDNRPDQLAFYSTQQQAHLFEYSQFELDWFFKQRFYPAYDALANYFQVQTQLSDFAQQHPSSLVAQQARESISMRNFAASTSTFVPTVWNGFEWGLASSALTQQQIPAIISAVRNHNFLSSPTPHHDHQLLATYVANGLDIVTSCDAQCAHIALPLFVTLPNAYHVWNCQQQQPQQQSQQQLTHFRTMFAPHNIATLFQTAPYDSSSAIWSFPPTLTQQQAIFSPLSSSSSSSSLSSSSLVSSTTTTTTAANSLSSQHDPMTTLEAVYSAVLQYEHVQHTQYSPSTCLPCHVGQDWIDSEEFDYVTTLNRILPPSIRVTAWAPVPPAYSARFNSDGRAYKYFFHLDNMDLCRMQRAARLFVGKHDFRNVCTMDIIGLHSFIRVVSDIVIQPVQFDIGCDQEQQQQQQSINHDGDLDDVWQYNDNISIQNQHMSPLVPNLYNSNIRHSKNHHHQQQSSSPSSSYVSCSNNHTSTEPCRLCTVSRAAPPDTLCEIALIGEAFLYHQVRTMVALLFMIGRHEEQPEIVSTLLDVTKTPRRPQYDFASDQGLILWATGDHSFQWHTTFSGLSKNISSLHVLWRNMQLQTHIVETMWRNALPGVIGGINEQLQRLFIRPWTSLTQCQHIAAMIQPPQQQGDGTAITTTLRDLTTTTPLDRAEKQLVTTVVDQKLSTLGHIPILLAQFRYLEMYIRLQQEQEQELKQLQQEQQPQPQMQGQIDEQQDVTTTPNHLNTPNNNNDDIQHEHQIHFLRELNKSPANLLLKYDRSLSSWPCLHGEQLSLFEFISICSWLDNVVHFGQIHDQNDHNNSNSLHDIAPNENSTTMNDETVHTTKLQSASFTFTTPSLPSLGVSSPILLSQAISRDISGFGPYYTAAPYFNAPRVLSIAPFPLALLSPTLPQYNHSASRKYVMYFLRIFNCMSFQHNTIRTTSHIYTRNIYCILLLFSYYVQTLRQCNVLPPGISLPAPHLCQKVSLFIDADTFLFSTMFSHTPLMQRPMESTWEEKLAALHGTKKQRKQRNEEKEKIFVNE